MNAAARLVHQNVLSRHLLLTHLLSRQQLAILILALAVICSALATIYVTHSTRLLHVTYHRNLQEQDRLQMLSSQLLLERSAWMIPARIQEIAENKLNMVMPTHESTVVIRGSF